MSIFKIKKDKKDHRVEMDKQSFEMLPNDNQVNLLKNSDTVELTEIYKLTIPSSPEYIEKVITYFLNKISDLHLLNREIHRFRITLSEAISNAIEHGNQFDSDKKVNINFNIDTSRIRITIRDEGEGFDYREVRKSMTELNQNYSTRGRGLFIIKNYMDKTYFESPGNTLVMIKYLNPEEVI